MENINGWYVLIFVLCLGAAAFFCSAETAFFSVQKFRLQHLVHTGQPRAKLVAKILEHPEKFLATVLLGINFFETAVAALGTIMAVTLWGEDLGAAIATITITILTLILAEFIPKSIAARYGERLVLSYAKPIEFLMIALYPFVFVLNHIGLSFSRMGVEDEPRPTVSQEEFRTMISLGHQEGTVDEAKAEMLEKVFEFGNRPVSEVMVPRTEVVWVEKGTKMADFLKLYIKEPMSRFPVYDEHWDNAIGILSVKDVLMAYARGTASDDGVIDELIRPPYFAPETKRVSELFTEMKEKNFRMTVVVDEFGGTAGIVSLSRLMEEIVGPVGDELAAIEKEYETINENTFHIDGGMRVEQANEELELELPTGDYETVAGFILHLLGHIPRRGEQVRYKGIKIVITEMRGNKIERILLAKEKRAAPTDQV